MCWLLTAQRAQPEQNVFFFLLWEAKLPKAEAGTWQKTQANG
jgi:hypothetical protein